MNAVAARYVLCLRHRTLILVCGTLLTRLDRFEVPKYANWSHELRYLGTLELAFRSFLGHARLTSLKSLTRFGVLGDIHVVAEAC